MALRNKEKVLSKNIKWYIYILICKDNTLYTGITNNLEKRLITHNLGKGAKYTRNRLPVKIYKSFIVTNKSIALKLEYKIKKLTKQQKLKVNIINDYLTFNN